MKLLTGSLDDRLLDLRDSLRSMRQPAATRADTLDIWQEIIDIQDFVFDLGADSLRRARLHTHLFTSYAPRTFVRLNRDQREPASYPPVAQYQFYVEDLPTSLWLSEPQLPGCGMPSGFVWEGRHINPDVARYQGCLANLHSSAVMDRAIIRPEAPRLLEVGGGFGGLAQGLFASLGAVPLHYMILDIPEMLIFAGAHVATHCPHVELVVCDDPRDLERLRELPLAPRLTLIPTNLNDGLHELPELDLVVAMASFQEMSVAQISTYVDVLANRCIGYLYSDNTEGHPDNRELRDEPLSTHLSRTWRLDPSPDVYDELPDGSLPWFHRAYIGTPTERPDIPIPAGSIRFIGGNNKKGRRFRYHFDGGVEVIGQAG